MNDHHTASKLQRLAVEVSDFKSCVPGTEVQRPTELERREGGRSGGKARRREGRQGGTKGGKRGRRKGKRKSKERREVVEENRGCLSLNAELKSGARDGRQGRGVERARRALRRGVFPRGLAAPTAARVSGNLIAPRRGSKHWRDPAPQPLCLDPCWFGAPSLDSRA